MRTKDQLQTTIAFRVPESLRRFLEDKAASDKRKLGDYVRLLLRDEVVKLGYMPPSPESENETITITA